MVGKTQRGDGLQAERARLVDEGLRRRVVAGDHGVAAEQLARVARQPALEPVGKESDGGQRGHGQRDGHDQQAQFAGAQVAPEGAPAQAARRKSRSWRRPYRTDSEPWISDDQFTGAVEFSSLRSSSRSTGRICSPTLICGLEKPSALPASVSRWRITGTAAAKACSKERVLRNCSSNSARPKNVSSRQAPAAVGRCCPRRRRS